MFKIQYPTDHLKKEGDNSKITELSDEMQYIEQAKEFSQLKRYRRSDVDSESESRFKRIDVPGDGSCLFWSVTMAYLIPVRNDDALFRQRYEALFGNEGAVTQNLDHIRGLVQNLSTANYDDTFANLVRSIFRNRVVDHISSHRNDFKGFVEGNFENYLENMRKPNAWGGEPEIKAMSEMLSARISVSGATESRYENGNIQIQLFHVGAPGNRNHYNFGLERGTVDNDVELAKGLKKVMGKVNPQDFELIQLLIEEAGKEVGINRQDEDFKSFEPRFQSFVDQIPSYLHSVEKAGFFTHFFLGSFSTLLDTEIAEKLNIKKIYFSFDTSKTLKVAIVKNGQIGNAEDAVNNINLFSISEGKRGHQFTADELKSILRNNIDRSKIKDRDIEKKIINIENKIQDRIKSRLVQIYKGKDGIFVNMEVKEILDSPASKEFHEIEKGIWNNPQGEIAGLSDFDEKIVTRSLGRVLGKISKVHSKYENSLIYDNSAREAAHHGFMVGVFMNFHYRYNLRVYPEQFAGRGYADIILLARGPDRALDSIPIIIELKAGASSNATPDKALQQAEKYAQGFQPNVQRVLTTADNILCVGVNFDNPSPISDIKVSNREEEIIPLFQEILESTKDLDTQTIGKRELKEQVKDNLERIYHTFPGTPEKGDNHYFSRFLLGQSLLLSEDSGANLKKYIFIYGDNIPTEVHPNLRGFGRLAAQRSREALSTNLDASHAVVTMVLIPENTEKLVYVINIVEANRKDVLNKALPLDRLGREIGGRKIVELGLNFDTRYKSDFKRYLTVWAEKYNSLQEYNNGAERFQGTFKEVPYPNELKETFDQALDAQSSSIDEYNKLLEKIGEGIFPFKSLVNKEAHFQGILNGVFSYYSDLKLQESPETRALVLTEFQTGRGERIDMLVHGIKFVAQGGNAEEYTPIGLELKASRQGKGAQALLKEANNQINEEYKEGVTYKTLTDGDEVKFIGVVFDKGSNNKNKLILTSRTAKEGFIPVEVVHSSVHMLPTVGQCSKRKSSSPEYPPSKKPRRERSVSMACIDSFDEEKITEEEKEQRIKELFNADKVAERVKNIEFYDQLFKVSQKISEGEIIDKNVEEAFIAKIKDVDLNSIDPEIRDIVKEIKDNIENKEEIKNILRRSGVAEKIGKVAEGAGLAFTVFLVGKHIANGDIEGLGYDALNLWVMPKIGEKISGKMLELGTKLDSQMLRGFAPVMGRAIGNFAAFLGLAESINARQSATDPVDIKIADLNIATNSIFIAADVPAVVTETMSAIGIETGIIGEFAGPVGAAVSVAVIIIAQFVEAGLQVKKLEEQIDLTDQEKHQFYWKFFLEQEIPDYIQDDIKAKAIYGKYISNILEQFKNNYDIIAMSLPSILVVEEEYSDKSYGRRRRHYEANEMILHPEQKLFEVLNGVSVAVPNSECRNEKKFITSRLNSKLMADIKYPFNTDSINHYSRLIPNAIGDYKMACGPLANEIKEEEIQLFIFDHIPKVSCKAKMKLDRRLLQWSLQEYPSGCYNSVVYRNKNSRGYGSMYHMPFQNIKIDVVYDGKNASEKSNKVENRYYFGEVLDRCRVYNPGSNFFYITGKFSCDLGADGQKNIVITQGNLTTDSINIHSIIGSNKANHIKVSYVDYVDGKGGNDVITVKNFTTIKGYFGDYIYGKGLVLLPINLSDIGNITYANNITNIYNKSGAFISVDKQILVKTADGSFVTPTKVDANTGRVTNLQITKLDDKLDNLQKIDNSNFNITKQLLSANYHSTIGSSSNHIFYPDKEQHNFYWEAPSNTSHLYLFDNRDANITIAKANGILDFSQLNCTLDDMPFTENNEGEIKINRNSLHVTLLPNYKDVTVTFDGEEYYKFQNGELERDYCSHSLKIDGRFSVNGTDLLNHHNCFTFDSDKVLFLKLNNNLLLLSDRGALSISNYYSSVHKNWDLSVGLNNRVMEPEEFRERADDFSSFRYYKPDEQGLQIYHNQPINKNDIGLVDLKGKSILDFDMKVMNDTLLLSHKNNTLVKVENWNTYQPAREMMFGFNDTLVSNSKCVASTCSSEDVVMDFNKEKIILQISNAIKQNNINAKDKDGKTLFHIVVNKGDLSYAKLLVGKIESMSFEESLYAESDKLVKAVRQRERLRFLINEKDNLGYTPLQYAAKNGKWDIVNLFLDKTAERNQDDVADKNKFLTSWTTMHYAVYNGNMDLLNDIFQFLSDKETIINTKDNSDWTPLHYAVYYNALDVVKFLVGKGADISARDKDGKIPLDLATQENDTGIAEFLKQTQLDLDKQLLTAVQDRNLSKAEVLVSRGANINTKNDDGYTSLHFAVLKNFQSGIDYLIKKGANIDAKDNIGRAPLHWAARDGYLDIVQTITEGGANLDVKDKDNKTPSDLASWKGYENIVQYLKQVQLDKRLLAAIKGNDCREVQNLVSQGANLEAKDRNGRTSLYWASCNGYLGVVQCLIDVRANLEVRDNNGDTPLHCAAWSGQLDIVKSLIDSRRADVNIKNDDGWTPLHWASKAGYLDVVQYLVNNRANVDARDKEGTTPLGIARAVERSNIVEYLEKKLNKEKDRPAQRKRRHHHGDHDRHHLSRNLLAIDSSNQPEIATSSGIRPSSWINDLFGWVKSSISGLLDSKSSTTTKIPISQIDAPMDVNGTIMLLDVLVRKVTGQKYISTVDQPISSLEAQGYALNITKGFEKVVEQAGLKSGVSMHRLNIDFVEIQKEVTGKIMSGKFDEISGILKSYIKKACTGGEAGKLSPKKFDKFIAQFNKGLLNQSIEQILHNRDGRLEVYGAKQMSLEPQSYLSNASVHSHSEVSTCLSEIGVTKLGNTLSK